VDYNRKVSEIYPNYKEYAEKRLHEFELVLNNKQESLKNVQSIVDTTIQHAKETYLQNNLEKEWNAIYEKEKQDEEQKESERKEKHKDWMRTYWLSNNYKKREELEKQVSH